MNEDKAFRWLSLFLGFGFFLFGIVETSVAINGRDNIGFFWFPTLCLGGISILLGAFVVKQPQWLPIALISAGCLSGGLATAWTILIPLLALALVAMAFRRPARLAAASA